MTDLLVMTKLLNKVKVNKLNNFFGNYLLTMRIYRTIFSCEYYSKHLTKMRELVNFYDSKPFINLFDYFFERRKMETKEE